MLGGAQVPPVCVGGGEESRKKPTMYTHRSPDHIDIHIHIDRFQLWCCTERVVPFPFTTRMVPELFYTI